jgi:hypothetical protein
MVRRTTCQLTLVILVALVAPSLAAASGVHALFDLDAPSTSPFPSDRFTVRDRTQNTRLRIDLPPIPDCSTRVSDCKDVDVLNTLDGFNLQPRLSIPFSGPIDVSTVSSETVLLVKLGSARRGGGRHHDDHDDADDDDDDGDPHGRSHRAQPIGINQIIWDVATNTLHVESDEFLDQHTRYALIVTRGVKDTNGHSVRPSREFEHFRHRHSHGLNAYRKALLKGLDKARAAGLHPHDIVAASVFTTQSITAVLEKIRDQIKAATPEPADFLLGPGGTRTVAPVGAITNIAFNRHLGANALGVPIFSLNNLNRTSRQLVSLQQFSGAVGHVAFGKYRSPDYLAPCLDPTPAAPCNRSIPPVGTRTGTPLVQGTEEIFFNLFLPAATPQRPRPASGWPVVILGLGSGDNKELGSYLAAPAMAAHGIALIAINDLGQGFGPLSTLTLSLDLDGNGTVDSVATFSSGQRSYDQNGDGLIGTGVAPTNEGNESLPQGSSISRRDVFRQVVVDLMQLVRVIEVGVDVDGDGAMDLDPSRIYFHGWSAGANHGTAFLAIEPRALAGVLNTTGGAAIESFRLSPINRPFVGRYFERRQPSLLNAPGVGKLAEVAISAPLFNENLPFRDGTPLAVGLADGTSSTIQSPVINTVPGAMEMQRVIEHTQWAQLANDPLAYAPYLRKAALDGVPEKSLIVQFARGDQTIPNPAMTAVIRAADLADRTTFFRNDLAFAANPTAFTKNSHQFAFRINLPITAEQMAVQLQAQVQIGVFLASDGTDIIDPDGACVPSVSGCLFETPIELPLPKDLGFIP